MNLLLLFAFALGGEVVNLILQSGVVARVVILILICFSVLSWAIILGKIGTLRRARAQSARFVRAFRKATRLQDVAAVAEQFKPSPLVGVLRARTKSIVARPMPGCAAYKPFSARHKLRRRKK